MPVRLPIGAGARCQPLLLPIADVLPIAHADSVFTSNVHRCETEVGRAPITARLRYQGVKQRLCGLIVGTEAVTGRVRIHDAGISWLAGHQFGAMLFQHIFEALSPLTTAGQERQQEE